MPSHNARHQQVINNPSLLSNRTWLSPLHLLPLCHYVPTLIPLTQLSRFGTSHPFFYSAQMVSVLIGLMNWMPMSLYWLVSGKSEKRRRLRDGGNQTFNHHDADGHDSTSDSTPFMSRFILLLSLLNCLYCIIMLSLTWIYTGVEMAENESRGDSPINPFSPHPVLPWWTLLFQLFFAVSGPTMECIIRMESVKWHRQLRRIQQNRWARSASNRNSILPSRRMLQYDIDSMMRVGMILAWIVAVVGDYYAACVLSFFGVVLACSWQYSQLTLREAEIRDDYVNSRVQRRGREVSHNQQIHDNLPPAAGNSLLMDESDDEQEDQTGRRSLLNDASDGDSSSSSQNSASNDEEEHTEQAAQQSENGSDDHSSAASASQPYFFSDDYQLNGASSGGPKKTTLLGEVLRSHTFFILFEFFTLNMAYFAFLRLSSLFMTSTISEYGFGFRWYDMEVVNAAAGSLVLLYLLLLHRPLLNLLRENQALVFGTLLGFSCVIPLPLLYYFARESGRKSIALWQFVIILFPLYHVAITMCVLSLRKKLATSLQDGNKRWMALVMYLIMCAAMIAGVLCGSSMYQLLRYLRKPQTISFISIGLLHIVALLLSMSKSILDWINPVESENRILFDDDLENRMGRLERHRSPMFDHEQEEEEEQTPGDNTSAHEAESS